MTLLPTDARADEEEARAHSGARAQRQLRLAGAGLFLAMLAMALPPQTGLQLTFYAISTTIVAVSILAGERRLQARYQILVIPLSASFLFGTCIVVGVAQTPSPSGTLYALLFALLTPLVTLLAPTRRGAHAALGALGVLAAAGAVMIASRASSFALSEALGILAAALATSFFIARYIEGIRGEGAILRAELERRATSDDIAGVSNRAHINLLAQNEFSRARRYGEPYTCLMIEIEGYDEIRAARGPAALISLVQVFTGYCVVVMRHCDSFGRLSSNRFLALLPETKAAGAQTLGNRMCADLGALSIAHAGEPLHFTVSIGCAEMHAVDRSAGDLLRRTAQALQDALERGGNCAVVALVPVTQPTDIPADGQIP